MIIKLWHDLSRYDRLNLIDYARKPRKEKEGEWERKEGHGEVKRSKGRFNFSRKKRDSREVLLWKRGREKHLMFLWLRTANKSACRICLSIIDEASKVINVYYTYMIFIKIHKLKLLLLSLIFFTYRVPWREQYSLFLYKQ